MFPSSDWRALPDEVLATIFEQVVAKWEDDQDQDFAVLGQDLKCFNATCRKWRDVALSTPRLWRNIYNADLGEGWHSPGNESPDDSLTLANGLASNIPIDASAAYYPFETCLRRSGAVSLRLYAERACGLRDLLLHLAESSASARVYFIEVRDLFRTLPEFVDDYDFNKTDYLRCPNLRAFVASGLGAALFADLYDMLSCHPGIESLCLKNIWWSWGDMEAREIPLELPKIRDFRISHHQQSCFLKTFEMLRMPHLERLAVAKTFIEASAIPALGAIVIHQSFPLVKEVVVVGLTTRDVTHILSQTPNMETLQIRDGVFDDYDDLFTRLQRRSWDEPTLCPMLQHIVLEKCPVSPPVVVALVQSRLECSRSLSSVAMMVEEWSQWPEEALRHLGALVQVRDFVPTHRSGE
ncbi:hypothetical protein CALCODRAFT_552961 [Calocera cornea HHB12733]|uniref:F-box domain-containing protein n=1 Tax=Calocera cornea HHB12733 TaxID=1353952 RepID=A0A165JBX4_9BASI|nr:hypothetical protein CALCODRAFT_552961 [Calocera cornea HHB12733]